MLPIFSKYKILLLFITIFTTYVTYVVNSDFSIFFIRQTDLQADYFYKALSFREFLSFDKTVVNHPGIVPTFLLSFIIIFFNDPILSSQTIFNVSYYVVALAYSFSLFYFYTKTKEFNEEIKFFLSLTALIFWPPFWYYLTCYGADSFVIPLCVVILTKTFSLIKKPHLISLKDFLVLAIFYGAGISTKLSILPIIIISMFGIVTLIYFELQNKRQEYLLKFIFYCISSFIIFCISALGETKGLIKNLFFNAPSTHLKSEFKNLSDFFFKFYEYSNISFSIFIIFLTLLIINLISLSIKFSSQIISKKKKKDFPSLLIFGLSAIFLVKVITINFSIESGAVGLRHISSGMCIFIFLLSYFSFKNKLNVKSKIIFPLFLLGIIFFSSKEINAQKQYFNRQLDVNNKVKEKILELNLGDINLYEGGETFSAEAFHFYGNNAYAYDKFDNTLTESFNKNGCLRLRSFNYSKDNYGSAFLWPKEKNSHLLIALFGQYFSECNLNCLSLEIKNEGYQILSVSKIQRGIFILIKKSQE